MNSKLKFRFPTVAALTMFAVTVSVLFTSLDVIAQSTPPNKEKGTTWQDLGYNEVPEGFSTDEISLFEGLNESRGVWSFKGETTDGQSSTVLQGSLSIQGNPQAGMMAMWKMDWGWPADNPEQMIVCVIVASPKKSGFDLGLIRIGPLNPQAKKNDPQVQRTMFKGTWDLKNRTITWTESGLPGKLGAQPERDPAVPKQAFKMVVPADGKISIQKSEHIPRGQLVSGKAIIRTEKAPPEAVTLTGKHRFKTVAEIADRRIKPWLPPQATGISLQSDRGGHIARYKVSEADFMTFMDQLWKTKGDSSAHKRESMSGEGEPAKPEAMTKRFKAAGWEPLDNATIYYSPSKGSGAMTTYYYDRKAGIAYHDSGYW